MRIVRKTIERLKLLDWEEGKINVEKEGYISLLFGENFVPVDKRIKEAIIKELDKINIYPSPLGGLLIEKLSDWLKIPQENIVVGNGIDDILNLIGKIFIEEGDEVITPTPTFPLYASVTELMGGKVIKVNLDENFRLNTNALLKKIKTKTKIIFIANPNNPTGNILIEREDAEKILKEFKGLLVIDECYYGICNKTLIDLIQKYNNLLILRSFSKSFGLAGLRVGYAVGAKEIISAMRVVINNCNPFILDRIAQVAAIAALECEDRILTRFKKLKYKFYSRLKRIKNLKVFPSETTFFLVSLKNAGISAGKFIEELAKRKVLIKDCSIYGLSDQFVRIPVPKEKDMNYVISAIKDIVS
jgi:histidinol-phosphate aminotransferase